MATPILFIAARASFFGQAPGAALTDMAAIRAILVDRVDVRKESVGIVAGLVGPAGRRVVAYGRLDANDARALDGDTIFEIGSTTKVFTSLLLTDMVRRGEVALSDPVAKLLPAEVKVPERGGRVITLQDLATHTSGLPRLPTNIVPKDPRNPYADYTVAQLYQFLATYQLQRNIGEIYEYSNLGVGLLGHALSLRAGVDYESLVRTRITGPLGMKDTAIELSADMRSRLAVGHDAALAPVLNWDIPTLAGAGALRSSANDMLTLLSACVGLTESPLAPPMKAMLDVQRPTPTPGLRVALAWHVFTRNGNPLMWHNGGTGGYRSFIGYDQAQKIAVVVLSNANTTAGVDDIGLHLLDSAAPLLPAPKVRKEVPVEPKVTLGYVGTYRLAPGVTITVRQETTRLFGQVTGQPAFEMFAEDERTFFLKVVDAQVTFEVDAQGRVTALVLHQNGRDQRAIRER